MHSFILVTFLLSLQRICHATFDITGQITRCRRSPVQPEMFNSVLGFYPLEARNILSHSVQNVVSHRHIYSGRKITPAGKAFPRASFHCYHCLSILATDGCWVKPLETLGTRCTFTQVFKSVALAQILSLVHSHSMAFSFPERRVPAITKEAQGRLI